MLLLGLLLMAATGAFVGLLIAQNLSGGPEYTVTLFNNHLGTLNGLGIFLAGIALALVFCLGMAMVTGAAALRRRRRDALITAHGRAAGAAAERDATAARATPDAAGEEPGGTTDAAPGPAEDTPASPRRRHRAHSRHLFGH